MTLPAWTAADETKPAPGPLLLVQAFVNTRDVDLDTDLLVGPDPGTRWLRQAGLLPARASAGAADLRAAREVREAIRALLAQHNGGPALSADELRPLDDLARDSRLRLVVSPAGRVELEPGRDSGLASGLLGLLLAIRDAQEDGSWDRLKACGNDDCRWAFYDRSHSRRGTWCDMAACGNLIKNRNLRARRSSGQPGLPPAEAAAPREAGGAAQPPDPGTPGSWNTPDPGTPGLMIWSGHGRKPGDRVAWLIP